MPLVNVLPVDKHVDVRQKKKDHNAEAKRLEIEEGQNKSLKQNKETEVL